MRLGIFGGTFNPIHLGHLMLAEAARQQYRLDQIWFIPTATPPHKPAANLLEGRHRLALIRLAIRGNSAFRASEMELARGGVSYTVETIAAIRRQHPRSRLFLLVGSDMLRVRWRHMEQVRRWCALLVAARSSSPVRHAVGAQHIEMPEVAISSTRIRKRLAKGQSVRYMVPEAVFRYLTQHRCYRREVT